MIGFLVTKTKWPIYMGVMSMYVNSKNRIKVDPNEYTYHVKETTFILPFSTDAHKSLCQVSAVLKKLHFI